MVIEMIKELEVVAHNGILCKLKIGDRLRIIGNNKVRIDGTSLIIPMPWEGYYRVAVDGASYRIIEEPCFVCQVEDSLGESRGTQSHPINCGWRIKRENEGYKDGLNMIKELCKNHDGMTDDECISKIGEVALSVLFTRYDVLSK